MPLMLKAVSKGVTGWLKVSQFLLYYIPSQLLSWAALTW